MTIVSAEKQKQVEFSVQLLHPNKGSFSTRVTALVSSEYHHYWRSIMYQARKNLASRFVDYELYDNDSAYLDMLDKVGEQFTFENISVVQSAEDKRWLVDAQYEDGEPWSEHVTASSQEEADFQARIAMALNTRSDPNNDQAFAYCMSAMTINYVEPDPVTLDELTETAARVYRSVSGNFANIDGLDELREQLAKLGAIKEVNGV